MTAGLEPEPVIEGGTDIEGDATGFFGGVEEQFAGKAGGDEDERARGGDGFEILQQLREDLGEDDVLVWVV